MKYYVQIEDPKDKKKILRFDNNQISSVKITFDSPDNVKSKMSKIDNLITISGKMDQENQEIYAALTQWALQDSSHPSTYRNVTIWIIGKDDKIFRKMIYPNCFIVDYVEEFIEDEDNSITEKIILKVKQQVDKLGAIEISSDAKTFSPEKMGFVSVNS